MAGSFKASVDDALVDDQPPTLQPTEFRKFEIDDTPPFRQVFRLDETMDVPHERARMKFLPQQLATDPALAPFTGEIEKRLQRDSGFGQPIFPGAAPGRGDALDHPRALERLQPLRQSSWRNQRDAQTKIIEVPSAQQQVSDQEQRPPFRQDFGSLRDRAVRAVALHDAQANAGCAALSSSFCVLDVQPLSALACADTLAEAIRLGLHRETESRAGAGGVPNRAIRRVP